MRAHFKGINSITKKLADGSRRAYWYAWKGGPALRGELGTLEFIASYNEAVARKVTPPAGVLLAVMQGYQASEEFRNLADSTRRSYIAHIKRIEAKFSDFPLSALTDRRTRGIFLGWRDEVAAQSGRRQADYAWTVLARILSSALNRGKIGANPCEKGGRVYSGSRADKVWTADDEAAFLRNAPPTFIYRCCSRYGPASVKGTCCDFLGRPTMAFAFDCGNRKPARAFLSRSVPHSKLC